MLEMPPDVASIVGVVDTYLRWKNKNKDPRGYSKYHPSEFGKCLRKMQYMRFVDEGIIQKPEETFTSQQLRLFEKGHNMQARWTRYFDGIGILRGLWKCSNPLCRRFDDSGNYTGNFEKDNHSRIYGLDNPTGVFRPEKCVCGCTHFIYDEITVKDDVMNMYGHADLILDFSKFDPLVYDDIVKNFNFEKLPQKSIVVDMKTIKAERYVELIDKGPDLGYLVQLTIYANLLDCEYGLLIYENKNDSSLAAYKVERNADTWFKAIRKQAEMMNQMAKDKKLPPPRPDRKTSYDCKYCIFKDKCHSSKLWNDEKLAQMRKDFYGVLLK